MKELGEDNGDASPYGGDITATHAKVLLAAGDMYVR